MSEMTASWPAKAHSRDFADQSDLMIVTPELSILLVLDRAKVESDSSRERRPGIRTAKNSYVEVRG